MSKCALKISYHLDISGKVTPITALYLSSYAKGNLCVGYGVLGNCVGWKWGNPPLIPVRLMRLVCKTVFPFLSTGHLSVLYLPLWTIFIPPRSFPLRLRERVQPRKREKREDSFELDPIFNQESDQYHQSLPGAGLTPYQAHAPVGSHLRYFIIYILLHRALGCWHQGNETGREKNDKYEKTDNGSIDWEVNRTPF